MTTSTIRKYVHQHGPITLFVLLTIAGSAIIWFGKLLDLDIALITIIPVGMMWVYLLVNLLPGLRVHSEQAGDNLYYMGFIFTLTSLGVSLYKFTGQASIEDVVRNFGIAIISTVMGIALRIFFNQMRRDPADIEKAVRHELAEMTRRVRAELDYSAIEFSSYRRTSNQMLSEGFEEIARQAEKNGEAVRVAIEAMSSRALQSIEDSSKRLLGTLEETHKGVAALSESNARNVERLTEQMTAIASGMSEKSKELSATVDSVIEKYAAAKSPDELLRIEVSPAVEALKSIVEAQAAAVAANAADTRETAKKVLSAIAPFKHTAAGLNALTDGVKAATETQIRSAETVTALAAHLEEVVSVAKSSAATLKSNGDTLAKLSDATAARHEEARAAEEANRSRTDRIEKVLSQSPGYRVQAMSPSVDETQLRPATSSEPIVLNSSVTEDEKPRKSWWTR